MLYLKWLCMYGRTNSGTEFIALQVTNATADILSVEDAHASTIRQAN